MAEEELIEEAQRLLALAVTHEVISMCVNPGHNHGIVSPCDEGCPDHIHSCSRGCGEWPCKAIQLGDLVAKYLAELQIIQVAYQQSMNGLHLAVRTLGDEFQQ
ncbi:hypothetical protein PBI_LUCKY3_45 [Microbacterium phage Lucky3]|uniref:Uncharacterized protein n=2 Tax=Kojivirus golden TaxID=2560590 RepID=A0A2P1CFU7_9CAUD|nr:hypothetical protein FDJ42_gp45 [Microbacterium phage Golden]AVJ49792.1 hypothetical protein PBI_GOLDEN_45 [Microbacterium phage Golden]AVJ50102.1 hypothetical protein PBI_LUCKY3_45 [Microbacterium phage Lucky3]